ncbi:hypothetical protein Tco_0129815, partial [Tanacetum coccineum]
KNEVLSSEEVAVLKREVGVKQYEINMLKTEFEKVKREKDAIDFKIEKFSKASKDLDQLLGSQITDKERVSNVGCEKESDNSKENSDKSLVKEQESRVSDDEEQDEPEKKTVIPTTTKIEKPVKKLVRYAEMYRSQRPRGNQRNWNGQKSNQLGSEFVMYNKACFNCGSFKHVQ